MAKLRTIRPSPRSLAAVHRTLLAAALTLLAAFAPPASVLAQSCGPAGTFGGSATAPAGSQPYFPAVADVNRDGRLDLLVTDSFGNTLRTYLGNGTAAPTPFPTILLRNLSNTPRGLAVADFDADGFLDAAVTLLTGNEVAVLYGDGTGNFPALVSLTTGPGPVTVTAGDFNDDGRIDIAVAANDQVQIFRKGGGRTFLAPTSIAAPPGLQVIVTADFERDGDLDLAVTHSTLNGVVVYLGNGAGGFTPHAGSPFSTGAGTQPWALVTADFNRDGIPDLATQSPPQDRVLVLQGDGVGGFGAPVGFPVGPNPNLITADDFDRDGILDVVSADGFANTVSLLRGAGSATIDSGSFLPALSFVAAQVPFAPIGGDFDRDGRPELVVVDQGLSQVVVLHNEFGLPCPKPSFGGVGRFGPNPPSGNPVAVAVGDLDGDFKMDAVTAGGSTVALFFGDGKGGVSAPTNLALEFAGDTRSVALGDLNADGRLDIVASAPGASEVEVFLNTGGGSFGPRTDFAMGSQTWALVLADLDGDGKLDVAATNSGAGNVAVRLGNGLGGFGGVSTFAAGGSPRTLAAGDLNGDLKPDLAVALFGSSQVAVLFGLGGGAFGAPTTFTVGASPNGVAIGDLDGDLDLDLAVSNSAANTVTLYFGNGGGAFGAPTTLATGVTPEAVTVRDLDGDGDLDLATANSGSTSSDVTVRLGNGGGSFGGLTRFGGFKQPRGLAFGDFNRDLKLDLAVPNWPNTLNGVVVVPGDGKGGFGNGEAANGAADLLNVGVGDLNRDGRSDLVSIDNGGTLIRVARGNGDGTFATLSTRTIPSGADGIVVADFNEDSRLDVAIGVTFGSTVSILLGDGAGNLGAPTSFPVAGASGARVRAVMDFNRDGSLDVVTANGFSNNISVLPGNGLGGLGAAVSFPVGNSPTGIAVGDLNRDGRDDLAVANFNANSVSILLDNGGGGFSISTLVVASGPAHLAAADFDRDGDLDLAVSQLSSTTVAVLAGNGAGGFPTSSSFAAGAGPTGVAALDANRDGVLDLVVVCSNENRVAVLRGRTTGGFDPPDSFTVRRQNPQQAVSADFDRDGKLDLVITESFTAPGAVSVLLNTNCAVRRLDLTQNVSTCHAAGALFPSQPALRVTDDGDNPIQCDAGPVAASIVPGTGTGGAVLGGTPSLVPSSGLVSWSDLTANLPGRGYQLQFDHPALVTTRSRTFSQGLSVSITGPAVLCEAQPATYTAGLGYDRYDWTLDSSPISMAPSVTLPGLSPGAHQLVVDVRQDTCPASFLQPVDVIANLGPVAINTGGATTLCTSCLGGSVTEAHGGDGGTLGYQWGYRMTSLGAVTPLAGRTSPGYVLNGADFPGPGSYFLVLTIMPACGSPTVSNEIPVTVTVAVPATEVPFFTVTSGDLEDTLQWLNTSVSGNVRIRFHSGPTACASPTDPLGGDGSTLLADVTGVLGSPGSFVHDLLSDPVIANDTHYCFTLWVDLGGGSFSTGRTNRGRPFDTTAAEKFAFHVGAMTLAPPGHGVGAMHVVGMDHSIHSITKGAAGGTWPTTPVWIPQLMNGPSQGRPSGIPVSIGSANPVLVLGSQDGHVYAFNARTGAPAWTPSSPALGNVVQAGPSGIFTAFGGAFDYILVGTRDAGLPNRFHALNLADGSVAWSYDGFDGTTSFGRIGIISGQAAVDYAARRVYFASRRFGPAPDDKTLWCLDLDTQRACWAAAYGDIDGAVTLRGNRLYVGTTTGEVLAVNAADGSLGWSFTPAGPDGPVKGYVVSDRLTDDVYFSTTSRVWSLSDTGPFTFAQNWSPAGISCSNPSTPVYAPGDPWVYVGSGDGRLYRLSVGDGSIITDAAFPVRLGDGTAGVGSPTLDLFGRFAYVATEDGVVHAVQLP